MKLLTVSQYPESLILIVKRQLLTVFTKDYGFRNFRNVSESFGSFGNWSLDYITFTYGFGPVMPFYAIVIRNMVFLAPKPM